jgi:hypothetical protein
MNFHPAPVFYAVPTNMTVSVVNGTSEDDARTMQPVGWGVNGTGEWAPVHG